MGPVERSTIPDYTKPCMQILYHKIIILPSYFSQAFRPTTFPSLPTSLISPPSHVCPMLPITFSLMSRNSSLCNARLPSASPFEPTSLSSPCPCNPSSPPPLHAHSIVISPPPPPRLPRIRL